MLDLATKENIERLSILVSGEGEDKLLGIESYHHPPVSCSLKQFLILISQDEWNIDQSVAAMCFNTTGKETHETRIERGWTWGGYFGKNFFGLLADAIF